MVLDKSTQSSSKIVFKFLIFFESHTVVFNFFRVYHFQIMNFCDGFRVGIICKTVVKMVSNIQFWQFWQCPSLRTASSALNTCSHFMSYNYFSYLARYSYFSRHLLQVFSVIYWRSNIQCRTRYILVHNNCI